MGINHNFLKAVLSRVAMAAGSLSFLSLTACPSGGDVTASNAPSTSPSYGIILTKVNNVAIATAPKDVATSNYITNSSISITGTCPRGVATVNAFINGSTTADTNVINCSTGSFTWSASSAQTQAGATLDGEAWPIVFKSMSAAGGELTSVTVNFQLDTTAPQQAAPNPLVITDNNNPNNVYSTSTSPVMLPSPGSFKVLGSVTAETSSNVGFSTDFTAGVATSAQSGFSTATDFFAQGDIPDGTLSSTVSLAILDRSRNSTNVGSATFSYVSGRQSCTANDNGTAGWSATAAGVIVSCNFSGVAPSAHNCFVTMAGPAGTTEYWTISNTVPTVGPDQIALDLTLTAGTTNASSVNCYFDP